MTRTELETAVYRRLNKNTTTIDTSTQTRIRHFLNQRHRRLLSTPGLTRFRHGTLTFASVAAQSRYALPNVTNVTNIWDTTHNYRLDTMGRDEYRRWNPDPSESAGQATHYVPFDYEPVAKQPSDPSALLVKSSSASDTTQVAYVEGEITNGYLLAASVTLTGTTAVLVSSQGSWERINKFYLSAACAGTVTLYEDSDSAAQELARITIGQTRQQYFVFHLTPQPSAAITYTADYEILTTDLAQATDEPRLPEMFHCLVELGATMDELVKTDDARYVAVKAEYDDEMRKLQYWLARQSSGSHSPREWSSLGAHFPDGS